MPDIKVTPGKNFSGDFSQITVTLSAKDTDSDSTVTTDTTSDSITLDIHVDPVAGDVSAGGVTTTEDSAVDFLKNLKLTDADGSEKITSITVNEVPAGWAIYDSAGNLVFTGDGAKDYSIDTADITGNKYADYEILPPKNSSADATLNLTVGTEDTGNGKTDTAYKALDIKVTVTPIAERVQETGDPTPADSNHELKMNDDHAYTTPGTEDTWFDLKTDGVNLKTPWKNLDTDNSGAEKTYALFTPVLTNGIAGESAIGSSLRYSTDGGTTWIEIKYTGEPIKIESQYLETVEFKAPDNVSGTFKIRMQAYTEDFDADNTETKVTNTSGAAELTDIVIAPVPDGIYTIAAAQAKGEEDTFINLSIKPASVDPSETFNVTIDGVPKDATIKYDGVEYTATSPNVSGSGITIVTNADGSFKITIDNFDTTKLFIRPPKDSNVDFDLTVTGVSVDGAATSTPYPATGGITLHVDVVGVADDVTVVNNPVASGTTAFTEAQAETGGIPISSFIVKQADKTDTSEIVTVRITGLQEGFSLSGANVQFLGGTGAGRSWLVTNPTDKDLITPPPNFSGEIKFQAQAVSTENDGNSKQSSMSDVTVVVTPTPEAAIHSSVEASEDVLTQVSFGVVHNNGDTDETVAYVLLKITDVDGSGKPFTLSYSADGTTGQSLADAAGNITGITIQNGYYKISGDAMGKIFIQGDKDWSGSETFEVKYGIADVKNAGQTAAINHVTSESDLTGGYKVTVKPVTNEANMDVISDGDITVSSGKATEAGNDVTVTDSASFDIKVYVKPPDDQDGSERLVMIRVEGIPDGVRLVGGTYLGDDGSGNKTGVWVLKYQDAGNDFNGNDSIEKTLQFTVDESNQNLWAWNGNKATITVTGVTQDSSGSLSGAELDTGTDASWNLHINFPTGDKGVDIQAPDVMLTKGAGTIEDSSDTTMWTLFQAQFVKDGTTDVDNSGVYRFKITVNGLPTGSEINDNAVADGKYIITGCGNNADLQSVLENLKVTLPKDFNSNNGTTNLNIAWTTHGWDNDGDTANNGGLQQSGSVAIQPDVAPVTDTMILQLTSTDTSVTENQKGENHQIDFSLNLQNGPDSTYGNILNGGKLYIKMDGAGASDKLVYNGTIYALETVSGVSGIANGSYYVIEGVTKGSSIDFTYQPANYHSGSFVLTAMLLVQEQGASNTDIVTSISNELNIEVAPIDSGYDIHTAAASGEEDALIKLNITSTGLIDNDSSENAYSAVLSGFGVNADKYTVWYGGSDDGAGASIASKMWNGTEYIWSLKLNADGSIPNVFLQSLDNYSGVENLTLSVLSGEGALLPATSTHSHNFQIIFEAVADGISSFAPTRAVGMEGSFINLNPNATVIDTDGSETVSISIKGLGDGVSFYNSHDNVFLTATYDSATDAYTASGIEHDRLGDLQFLHTATGGVKEAYMDIWTVEESGTSMSTHSGYEKFDVEISNAASGNGDDMLIYKGGAAAAYDGGEGDDTLVMPNYHTDLTNNNIDFNGSVNIKNIEVIDLRNGDHTLDHLSAKDVLDMTDSGHTLTINGENGDAVKLTDLLGNDSDGMWESTTKDADYTTYTGHVGGDEVILKIANEIMGNPASGLTN